MNDHVADLLARLQNGVMKKKERVDIPVTKLNKAVLDILVQEEMIVGYEVKEEMYDVELMYEEGGEPVVTKFTKKSKLGQRLYISAKEILPIMNGRGISIISTSQGVMSGAMAKSKGVGGELICEVW